MNTTTNRFTHLLATRPWLLADGATGSNLFDVGLVSGDAPEAWNFERPHDIGNLHRSFVDAGADNPVERLGIERTWSALDKADMAGSVMIAWTILSR